MHYTRSPLCHGYANQTLTIDLHTGHAEVCPLDTRMRDFFIGGRGLGLYLLHQRVTSRTDACDPENPLIFSPGPLGGIPQFPGSSKCMAVSLSPLTRIPGVSNFGGYFGAYLKYAGFDALTVTGIADAGTMIVIDGFASTVTVTRAPGAASVFDLEKILVDRFVRAGRDRKEIAFLTTGVGAANTVFGCINSHYYDATKPVAGGKGLFRTKQAGRTGLGSVMRHKNITAIVVLASFPHGDNPYGAEDWGTAKAAGLRLHKIIKEVDPQALQMYLRGSAGVVSFMNKQEYQSLPVNNFQYGSHPEAGRICGKAYAEGLFEHRGMDGCFPGCNLRCTKGGWVTLTTGEQAEKKVWVDGPEYETAAGFGSNLGVWHPEFIMEANWHCDNYGIDTISTAVIMAFIMECYQRGYLIAEDTDGFVLTWGDEKTALQFIHDLANRKTALAGVAASGMIKLARWVAERYAARTGNPAPAEALQTFAMQTKGLPFSLYRTHRSLSMQASYAAASDIGAHHAAAWLVKVDLLGAFPTFADKARALIMYPRVRLGNDNLGLCKLPWVDVFNPESLNRGDTDIYINPASQELYADFYNAMLGTALTWEQIFERTDRDINLQRVMNVMAFGEATLSHDWIPDRAIGPTEDALYELERDYNDAQLALALRLPADEIAKMETAEKRRALMKHRKEELSKLIHVYYQERGWTGQGVPKVQTLRQIGLWAYLSDEAREIITRLNSL
ncbi:MAG: aldehyde ferredoxin oxidoreductase C-terminal domain-containing protein [Smithellaceae bacterium]